MGRITANEAKKIILETSDDVVKVALDRYALELERLVVETIDSMKLNVTGDMRKSIKSLVRKQVESWVLSVGTNQKYAPWVHEGTKPHWPPIKPIREWVRKKINPPINTINSVAYAISRKISKDGTKPHPFMRVVFHQEKNMAAKKIANYIKSGLRNDK